MSPAAQPKADASVLESPISDLRTSSTDTKSNVERRDSSTWAGRPTTEASSSSTTPSSWGIWGHPNVLRPTILKEDVSSRESRLGLAGRMREKYGINEGHPTSSDVSGGRIDSASNSTSMPPPSSHLFPSAQAPASCPPGSDLRTPMNDPSPSDPTQPSDGSSRAGVAAPPPAWGMWGNASAVQEIRGLHTAQKSKASEASAALYERMAKKARMSLPASNSTTADPMRRTSSGSSTSAAQISPTSTSFPPPSNYQRSLSAQPSPTSTSTSFPSSTFPRPLFPPSTDGASPAASRPGTSDSGREHQSLPPISSMTSPSQQPYQPSAASYNPSQPSPPSHHHYQSSYATRPQSGSHHSSSSSSSCQRPPQPSTFAGPPPPPHSEGGSNSSSTGRRSPGSPASRPSWSDRRVSAISVASDHPAASASRSSSGPWRSAEGHEAGGGEESSDSPVKRAKAVGEMGGKSQAAFVVKLYQMLDDPALEGAIEWKTDSSFIVPDPEYFARVICPQQFKHSNWQSFVRQLNMYGFSKVSSEWQSRPSTSIPPSPPTQQVGDTLGWEFRHPCFIRGQTHLLQQIKRKAVKSADKKPLPPPHASSSSLHPSRHDDDRHHDSTHHHHQPLTRNRHSEGDGGSLDDLISAAEDASERLPVPSVPSHSSSSVRHPHQQHPSPESGQHRISDPWNPPVAALSPALAAMTDRIAALEEGLHHSRMDALQSQRDLARSVLAVMDRHGGDESSEERKEDMHSLRLQLESQRDDWTRRQQELQRSGGDPSMGSYNRHSSSASSGGGRPKGILGLLNDA